MLLFFCMPEYKVRLTEQKIVQELMKPSLNNSAISSLKRKFESWNSLVLG
jgi:hypothetical protein